MHTYEEKKAIKEFGDVVFDKPDPSMQDSENVFSNRLVVMDNLLARASTRWTLEETKIFLMAVSLIDTMNSNFEVTLPKRDILGKLDIDSGNGHRLRATIKKIATKSWVEFHGYRSETWSAGYVVFNGRYDEKNLYLAFNPLYVPLVKELKTHFCQFELDDILGFSHKGSLNLYMYLTSWFDDRYPWQSQTIKKSEIQRIFGLKDGQYWRDWGTDKARFDWAYFERRVLKPAIEDINNSKDCDLCIDSWYKEKDGKEVLGYHFRYCYTDKKTGVIAWRGLDGRLTGES